MRNAGDVLRTTPAILVLNIYVFFVCCRIFDFFLWSCWPWLHYF